MNTSRRNSIVCVDDNTARVTKAFAKSACIFGTREFELWREYKKQFPDAVMTTKTIKRNPDKKNTRNKTYENMKAYIRTLKNADELLVEFELAKKRSKVQRCPYDFVLGWFEQKFKDYKTYDNFFEDITKEQAEDTTKEHTEDTTEVTTERDNITAFSDKKAVNQ